MEMWRGGNRAGAMKREGEGKVEEGRWGEGRGREMGREKGVGRRK